MTYKWITENVSVRRLSDSANIPNDPANTDWQRFQKWLAEGNTPQPADPDTSVGQANAIESGKRSRARKLEQLERDLDAGSLPQAEINSRILHILKDSQ